MDLSTQTLGGFEGWLAGLSKPIELTRERREGLVSLAKADLQDTENMDDHTLEYMYGQQLDALITFSRKRPWMWEKLIKRNQEGTG